MKTTRVIALIVLLVVTLLLIACGRNKAVNGELVTYPSWWNTQADKENVCSYGMATKESQTMSIDAAKANALLESAHFVETQVKGMIKNYEEEAGVYDPQLLAVTQNVVKVVSNVKFSGVSNGKIETYKVKDKDGVRYTTYIQMKVPKNEINKNLYKSILNEEALYNQFKASQAFQELEEATK